MSTPRTLLGFWTISGSRRKAFEIGGSNGKIDPPREGFAVQFRSVLCLLCSAIAPALACSANGTTETLVGSSGHFRLFVDPRIDVPPNLQGSLALAALEANWSDASTLLGLPEGTVDYHWASDPGTSCDDQAGCEWHRTVVSRLLPDQHELTHAYMELRTGVDDPIPFLAEGAAQAFGCGFVAGVFRSDLVPWQQVVAETPLGPLASELYAQAGLFARYLIRSYGVGAYISYYQQAPAIRDPALFAANFRSVWHTSLDDIWTAAHDLPARVMTDRPICPCSRSQLPVDAQTAGDAPGGSYWTLPMLDQGTTLQVDASDSELVGISDCAGLAIPTALNSRVILQRPSPGPTYFVAGDVGIVSSGQFISDVCSTAVQVDLPADLPTSVGGVSVVMSRASAGDTVAYLKLNAPFAGHLLPGSAVSREVCDTCAFDQGSCQPALGAVPVNGPFYLRIAFGNQASQGTLLASDTLSFGE